ncbi:hypothetical protein Tco_1150132 [Tanacetum coccineum]
MKLPTELSSVLEEDMSIEVWRAIKDCEGDKATGPHGFTIGFIKFAWKTIKEDFGKMLTEFSNNASLPKADKRRIPRADLAVIDNRLTTSEANMERGLRKGS